MDYKSALPKNNDNISHDSPVKEALVMFSGVIAFFLIAYFILGLLVDWAVIRISPEMEAVIFSGFQVSPDLDRLEDQSCQASLQQLTDDLRKFRIKSATDTPDFKSPSRHANGRILVICVCWRNAGGGLKDK